MATEGLFDRLRKQASQSPAPQSANSNMGSSPTMPQQQYHREERVSSAPSYTSETSTFLPPPPYQPYEQASARSQTPPIYNPPLPAATDRNRTESLLGLLKFTHAPSPVTSNSTIPRETVLSPPPLTQSGSTFPASSSQSHTSRLTNAQDLVASLLARSTVANPSNTEAHSQMPYNTTGPSSIDSTTGARSNLAPVNPQDLVLQLFNRPKPLQGNQSTVQNAEPDERDQDHVAETPSPNANFGTEDIQATQSPLQKTPTPPADPHSVNLSGSGPFTQATGSQQTPSSTAPGTSGPNKTLFTYVNPFDQLHALSPKNKAPKQNSPGPNGIKKSMIPTPVNPVDIPLPFSPKVEPSKVEFDENDVLQQIDMRLKAQMEKREKQEEKAKEVIEPSVPEPLQPETGRHPEIAESAGKKDVAGSDMSKEHTDKDGQEPQETSKEPAQSSDAAEREEDEEADYVEHQGPIKVFNFPMKPFSAITINHDIPNSQRPRFPLTKMSDIARMPRQFDQLDRNLIAASSLYIVYAISKSNGRGGIRVLRQEDGQDRVLNKDTWDRTFNVVIGRGERILGTAVSGAVLWADIGEGFETNDWQSHSFIFPPSEEQGQTNGVLKSRARKSSRHIDVFAIGRGKTISIIHAPTAKAYAQGHKGNEVASKKYLADHSRIIDTGKASKDFCFSEDDTVIISIDKAGKLKLWDVQDLVNFGGPYTSGQAATMAQSPMLLSTPAMVLSAVAAGESYRATSVMFLDKHRPFHKGLALRYVIVGMKQNHTLQLWDLALQRPVQEIHFPQSSDTDALCSVAYHPPTGIVVVGNPTRNSIYFIHLSAPKYNLPPQSQAQYIKNLASKSNTIPKPDATAILSGLREYSFASKGQLMSLEILDSPSDTEEGESSPLFELYVAHSKGMTSLSVHKEDLGWDAECKTKHPVDAVVAKVCTISPMPQPPPPAPEPEPSTVVSPVPTPDGLKPATATKEVQRRRSPSPATAPPSTTASKSEKSDNQSASNGPSNRKKKGAQRQQQQQQQFVEPTGDKGQEKPAQEKALASKSKVTALTPTGSSALTVVDSQTGNALTPAVLEREVKKIESSVSAEFSRVFSAELDKLYKSLSEDRRVQQAAGDAKQEALLKLLSSTLTENVERVLADIVRSNIEQQVVPAIATATTQSIERRLSDAVGKSLSQSIPAELRNALPDLIKRSISSADVIAKIAEACGKALASQLSGTIERELTRVLHASIFPAFQQMALDTAHKVVSDVDMKNSATFAALERIQQQESRKMDALIVAHQHDTRKVEQLMVMVQQLTETITTMSRTQGEISRAQAEMTRTQLEMSRAQQDMIKQQTEFQEQVQKAQADWLQGQNWPEEEESAVQEQARQAPQPSPQQIERDEIDSLFRMGKFEEATIRWLQSKDRQEELFDEVVRRYRYDFMPSLSQLVLLSVSAAVTVNFENSVQDRINWLEGVLSVLDPRHPEIAEICQRIMAVVVQRLEQSYMRIAERDPTEPALRKIPALAKRARELGNLN
ncbi:hypothetical protein BDZ91DRAFT_679925 [Kalaharituber pfeilii]|nr:hypothetical protein BDZ91DRAFT_679925 [Kalaharituber pfeilii]